MAVIGNEPRTQKGYIDCCQFAKINHVTSRRFTAFALIKSGIADILVGRMCIVNNEDNQGDVKLLV